jgi:anti-anti-sigma regulatory factor
MDKFINDHNNCECKGNQITIASIPILSIECQKELINGLECVQHKDKETIAFFKGKFDADILSDFDSIQEKKDKGRVYRLDFKNVTEVSPSGLAMILLIESGNEIILCNCNEKITNELSMLNTPELNISFFNEDITEDNHQFSVSIRIGDAGQNIVTIRIAKVFSYNCRNNFANIYRGVSRKSEYILDFQDTICVGKAAYGTMLLLRQYAYEQKGNQIKIINCNESIKKNLLNMKFDRFFTIQ